MIDTSGENSCRKMWQLPLQEALTRGCLSEPSTDLPHTPDLQLWLHPRLLGLHCLVGHDGAHSAARAHVVEHDILHRHQDNGHGNLI